MSPVRAGTCSPGTAPLPARSPISRALRKRTATSFVLTDPAARPLFGAEWAVIARRMVTQFRAAHDLWTGDPAFAELAARLRRESREFARWWSTHDVGETRAGRKVLHRADRAFPFVHASFQSN